MIETALMRSSPIGPERGLPLHQEAPRLLGERRELARFVGGDVLRRGAAEQGGREPVRHVVAQAGEDRAHLLDEPAPGPFLIGDHEGWKVHGVIPGGSVLGCLARRDVASSSRRL